MHILLIADGRSPITYRWLQGLFALQHKVTLVSTFPCAPVDGLNALYVLPIAFSGYAGSQAGGGRGGGNIFKRGIKRLVSMNRGFFQSGRAFLGPLSLPIYRRRLEEIIEQCQPDLVHALRIPFEGMFAASAHFDQPLIVSIWGNDLTLHANSSAWMRRLTVKTLQRADGLITDVHRDVRLAYYWGFAQQKPNLVVLTSGGIDLVEMGNIPKSLIGLQSYHLPQDVPWVINPRGIRPGYVKHETFFKAIPLLLERNPNVHFVCPSMEGQPEAVHWVRRLGIERKITLLPFLNQAQLWQMFRLSDISVSITVHDGTPNTLLEAMALGSFPVAGDIESLREWITPGVNGMLVEPDNPQQLADVLNLVLRDRALRETAAEYNLRLVSERAEVNLIRSQIQVFYQRISTRH